MNKGLTNREETARKSWKSILSCYHNLQSSNTPQNYSLRWVAKGKNTDSIEIFKLSVKTGIWCWTHDIYIFVSSRRWLHLQSSAMEEKTVPNAHLTGSKGREGVFRETENLLLKRFTGRVEANRPKTHIQSPFRQHPVEMNILDPPENEEHWSELELDEEHDSSDIFIEPLIW